VIRRRLSGFGVDDGDHAIARQRIELTVGGADVDAEYRPDAFDLGEAGGLAGGGVDGREYVVADQRDDGLGMGSRKLQGQGRSRSEISAHECLSSKNGSREFAPLSEIRDTSLRDAEMREKFYRRLKPGKAQCPRKLRS
jgi:hypothetical protein